eukprot:5049676-Amphidinium_carterae.1
MPDVLTQEAPQRAQLLIAIFLPWSVDLPCYLLGTLRANCPVNNGSVDQMEKMCAPFFSVRVILGKIGIWPVRAS